MYNVDRQAQVCTHAITFLNKNLQNTHYKILKGIQCTHTGTLKYVQYLFVTYTLTLFRI